MIKNHNLIRQPGICCIHCGKSYKKRKSLDNHILLCEILVRRKPNLLEKEQYCQEEESIKIPNPKQMYQIIMDLAIKCKSLEEKIEEMRPFVNKQKKKIDVLEWLNVMDTNAPSFLFDDFIKHIQLSMMIDIPFLFQHTLIETINEILEREIYDKMNHNTNMLEKHSFPIFASVLKPNVIYIYNINKESNKPLWQEITKEDFVRFLNKINVKLINTLSLWKQNHEDLENSVEMTENYNKTVVKLMNIDFNKESTSGRIRAPLYMSIKKDINM